MQKTANIHYTLNKTGKVYIIVSDISGANQKVFNVGNKTAGTYTQALNAIQDLKPGNYKVAIQQQGKTIAFTAFVIIN